MKHEGGIITTNNIVWDDKVLLAKPPEGGRCGGCYFRKEGYCHRPAALTAYVCVPTLRADRKDIIWKDMNA